MIRRYLAFLLFLFSVNAVYCQYFTSGEDPSSIQWKQIDQDHFKIVFPTGFEYKARCLAIALGEALKHLSYPSGYPKKISVLIHNRSAWANGFVTWAPKRMELFPVPGQALYSQSWMEQLSLHEFRHVVQIDGANTGFTRFLSFAFGQQATGAVVGLTYPMWYVEGDAVLNETIWSESGRGRMPEFSRKIRAQLLDKNRYHYDKAFFGSYRDFVPDYYEMGYHLVAAGRQIYGDSLWLQTVLHTARNSWYPFNFSRNLKKYTGMHKVKLYESVFDSLSRKWKNQDEGMHFTGYTQITRSNKSYKNYRYPVQTDSLHTVAEVDGPGELRRFVEVDEMGNERIICIPGERSDEPFTVSGGKLVWTEIQPDIRWGNASSSILKCALVNERKVSVIRSTGKYYSPALSSDHSRMAVVSYDENTRCFLEIIDANSWQTILRMDHGEDHLMNPAWSDNPNLLALLVLGQKGKSIYLVGVNENKWEEVLSPTRQDIKHLVFRDHYLYFTGSWSGIDNLYRMDLRSREIVQLTSERFGADYTCVPDSSTIVYSRYSPDGYHLVRSTSDQWLKKPLSEVCDHSVRLFNVPDSSSAGIVRLDYSGIDTLQVKKYSKWNLFRIHSWAPAYASYYDQQVNQGVYVMSHNLLNTFFVEAGYNGDPDYSFEKYMVALTYGGWFPKIRTELRLGDSASPASLMGTTEQPYMRSSYQRQHTQLSTEVFIPFNFSRGRFLRLVNPSVSSTVNRASGFEYTNSYGHFDNGDFIVDQRELRKVDLYEFYGMEYDLFMYNLARGCDKDVNYRWGQVFEFNFRHELSDNLGMGTLFAGISRIYFPGLFKFQSFFVENDFQIKTDGNTVMDDGTWIYPLNFSSIVSLPRGYGWNDGQKTYSFKSNYSLPLANPDVSLGGLFYLKRLKLTAFYDYSFSELRLKRSLDQREFSFRYNLQSIGIELLAEGHAFRFFFPIHTGFRWGIIPGEKKTFTEFLFSMNIIDNWGRGQSRSLPAPRKWVR